jgi:hypothetical protein
VSAGGGSRCLGKAGYYRTSAEAIDLAPARAAAANAGAAAALSGELGCQSAPDSYDKQFRVICALQRLLELDTCNKYVDIDIIYKL